MNNEQVDIVNPTEDGCVEFILKNKSIHKINIAKIQQEINNVFFANGLSMNPIGCTFEFQDNGVNINFDITAFRAWSSITPKR